mmetsp:Transcript_8/g.46  ORF Transcript_8/g.46 Transcript_8/m.46 type:complete len:256 (-) Transcript_8:1548-2315(-)
MRPTHGVILRGSRAILQHHLVLRAFLVRRVVFRFVVAGVRRRRRLRVARARGSRVFLWRKRRHLHAPPHAGRRRRLAYGLRVVERQPPGPAPLHLPEHELARVPVDPGFGRGAGFVLLVRARRGPLNLHRVRRSLRVQHGAVELEVVVVVVPAAALLGLRPPLGLVVVRCRLLLTAEEAGSLFRSLFLPRPPLLLSLLTARLLLRGLVGLGFPEGELVHRGAVQARDDRRRDGLGDEGAGGGVLRLHLGDDSLRL